MPEMAQRPYPTSPAVAASRTQSSRRITAPTSTPSLRWARSPRVLVSTASITLRRYRDQRRLRLEVRLENLERRRRRRGATVAAVLDQRADDDRRRIGGGVTAPLPPVPSACGNRSAPNF